MFVESQTSALEIPEPRVLPIVAGVIVAMAVVGFMLGLKAGDRDSSPVISGVSSSDAAALAKAPNAAPIIINPTEVAPPPPPPPKEEAPVVEAAAPVANAPLPTVATPPPLAVPPPEAPPPAPPPAAAAIY